jgi:hypothetical protein
MAVRWPVPAAQTKAPNRKPASGAGTVLLRRVVVLTLPQSEAGDPKVRQQIAAERAPKRPVKRGGKQEPEPAGELTPAQWRAVGETFFAASLADRLHQRLNVIVVPEAEVAAALQTLNLSPAEAAAPEGAQKLCAQLDGDALLVPGVSRVSLREARTRDVALWGGVNVAFLRVGEGAGPAGKGRSGRPVRASLSAPTGEIPVAGAASSGRALFRSQDYAAPRSRLALLAAQQAAAQAVHTLWTGETAPLCHDGERIAVTPVLAPTKADKLLFTPQGRYVQPAAVRGLPPDVSNLFAPDLLPLSADAIKGPDETRPLLLENSVMPSVLWSPGDQPDIARVQELGRLAGTDYVLLARVTNIEVTEGPPPADTAQAAASSSLGTSAQSPQNAGGRPSPPVVEEEARAVAVGALVRVKDGALLWQDRATATMTTRQPEYSSAALSGERQVVRDATRFALLQLQRQFRHYRAGFEQ